jgi:hypothetical protein
VACTLRAVRLLVLVGALLVAVLTGCGGRGGDRDVACSIVFADGTTTPDLDHQPRCIGENGKLGSVASHRWLCTDDSELFVNDYGYGVNGDPWHADSGVIAQRLGSRGPGTPDRRTPFGRAVRACQPIR